MQKRFFNFFCIIFYPNRGRNGKRGENGEDFDAGGPQENRNNVAAQGFPGQDCAELEISQCTVYTELKRGQETDGVGDVVLDENFRPAYSAERGKTMYQRNLRNRGRRPKRGIEKKEAK